ncbi:MAG: molybdenum cofactor guanylyltransferase MobA [Pseudomonadota bacterium]
MMRIAGVILAGGLARRMGGGDKALLPVAGQPLLGHVIARLRPQVSALALNANGDAARFAAFGLPVLADTVPDFAGPLAGVLAGMRWAAAQGASHVVSAAGDTPFFPDDLARRLAAALGPCHRIAVAATQDPERGLSEHPTFGLWPVDLADDLEAALRADMRKVIVWASRHGCARAVFDEAGAYPFFNVNTPEDLAEAERLALGTGAEEGA